MRISPLIIIAGLIFCPSAAWAGAWAQRPGSGFVMTQYMHYQSSREFNRSGDKVALANGGQYTKQSVNAYFEQGLSDKFTMAGSLNYDFLSYKDSGSKSRQSGLSDQTLGLRYGICDTPAIVSFQGNVKFPAFYDNKADLPLGNGQVDIESWLLFGKDLNKFKCPFYINLELGYIVRLSAPPDAVKVNAALGYKGIKNTDLAVSWSGTRSMGSGKQTPVGKNIMAFVDYDLDRLDLSASYAITPRFSVLLDYFAHLSGKNTGAGSGINAGTKISW